METAILNKHNASGHSCAKNEWTVETVGRVVVWIKDTIYKIVILPCKMYTVIFFTFPYIETCFKEIIKFVCMKVYTQTKHTLGF